MDFFSFENDLSYLDSLKTPLMVFPLFLLPLDRISYLTARWAIPNNFTDYTATFSKSYASFPPLNSKPRLTKVSLREEWTELRWKCNMNDIKRLEWLISQYENTHFLYVEKVFDLQIKSNLQRLGNIYQDFIRLFCEVPERRPSLCILISPRSHACVCTYMLAYLV